MSDLVPKVKITGRANVDISAEDGIKLYVTLPVEIDEGGVVVEEEEVPGLPMAFSFCDQWTGIQCPMPAGTEFEAVISWTETPLHRIRRDEILTSSLMLLVEPRAISCYEEVHFMLCDGESDWLYKPAFGDQAHGFLKMVGWINSREERTWTAEVSPRFLDYSVSDMRRIAGGTVMRGQRGFDELRQRKYFEPPITTQKNPFDEPLLGAAGSVSPERRLSGVASDVASTVRHRPIPGSIAYRFETCIREIFYLADDLEPMYVEYSPDDVIPDSFDAREAFPECASVIGRVRDQSDCGSCWAFASTEAFNDRRCIANIGRGNAGDQLLVLSAEDTTACCHGFSCGLSMGCNGGQPGSAWRWFKKTGVVTGGDYRDIGKGTTCKPYEFMPCAHHVDPKSSGYPACPDGEYPTPECRETCSENDFGTAYGSDKRKAKEAYSLSGVSSIQRDMMKHGSVTASFSVYSDFITYSTGVYKYVTGNYLGGHAVKIIGWGTDEDTGEDYWLVVNSWNDSWGEHGLFRIRRGGNECGIEGSIVAGEA